MMRDIIVDAIGTGHRARRLALLMASLLLAIWGQHSLLERTFAFDGVLSYVVALFLFLWALVPSDASAIAVPVEAETAVGLTGPMRKLLNVAAVGLGFAAFLWLGNNNFSLSGTVAWFAACAAFMAANWEWPSGIWWRAKLLQMRLDLRDLRISWTWVVLAFIVLLGAFFRFHQLAAVPGEMTSDHVEKLLDVRDILNGKRPIFLPNNAGREALMFYWTALWTDFLGFSFWTLKFSAALAGLFCIPAVYLLAREFFDSRVGLIAAFFVAVSKWHVNMSRNGLRYPFASLASALALYFLYRALRGNRRSDWLLAGLLMGLGQFGYTSMRVMPLVFAACVLAKLVSRRDLGLKRLAGLLWNASLAVVVAILAVIPMVRYAYDFPQMFLFRSLTRATSLERPLPADPVMIFLNNLKNSLLMFNWQGDVSWFDSLPYDPMLDYVSAAFFVLGIGYVGWMLVRRHDIRAVYLAVAFVIFLLPSTMAIAFPIENPSASRSSSVIPVVAIIVALPVSMLIGSIHRMLRGPAGVVLIALVLATLGLISAQANYITYFVQFNRSYLTSAPNSSEMARAARGFAESLGDLRHVYLVVWPNWVDHRAIAIEAGDPSWANLLDSADQARQQVNDPANKLYIINVADRKSVDTLQGMYASGQTWTFKSAVGKDFVLFFTPGTR